MEAAAPGLLLGLAAGALSGAALGWRYLKAGFPRAFAFELAECATLGLFGALGFLVLYRLSSWLARRSWFPPWAVDPFACAVACTPFFLLAGYEVNRRLGTTLSGLLSLSPGALWRNAALAAILLVVYLALLAGLRGWRRGGGVSLRLSASLVLPLLSLPLLAQGALFLSSRPSGESGAPVVLLLVIDALRADHLGCYGHGRSTSPEIDALARDAVLFRQTISQGTFTKTSIASLLTSRLPHQHGVLTGRRTAAGKEIADVLPAAERTLAELLRERGFLTAAWVKNPHLREIYGFDQGFVAFHENQRSISSMHRRFLRWLPRVGAETPFFVYLHYLDLHDPYRPRPPFDTMFGRGGDPYAGMDLRRWGTQLAAIDSGRLALSAERVERMKALYDGQLRYIDEEIGRLLRELRERGIYDRALIVLTSDHGDGFMEHGFLSHSRMPYEELVRVPLLVKLPGSRHAGRQVEGQVRLIDVLPTVLEAMGAEPPRRIEGCSLLGLLEPSPPPETAGCFAYAVTAHGPSAASAWVAIRTERYKYIFRPGKPDLFFDLAADPRERRDLSGMPVPALELLRRRALEVVGLGREGGGGRRELDPEAIPELKALGYLQ